MLNFESFRGLIGGEHFIRNELRQSEYTLTANKDMLKEISDQELLREEIEEKVVIVIRQAFSLPTERPQQRGPQPRITTKGRLHQLKKIGGLSNQGIMVGVSCIAIHPLVSF